MARPALKKEDSISAAWKILHERLGDDAAPDEAAIENSVAVARKEDSISAAWKILHERLGDDTAPDEAAIESPAAVAVLAPAPALFDLPPMRSSQPPMRSSQTLQLTLPPPRHQGPVTFAGSLAVHALAIVILWFGFAYSPRIVRVDTDRAMVRELELQALNDLKSGRIPYPNPQPKVPAPLHKSLPTPPPAPRPALKVHPGPQTLIQPDLPKPVTLPMPVPVPRLALWAPTKTVVQKIVPPKPAPPAANAHPVLDRPNRELQVADVNLTSSNLPTLKLQLAPGATSPIAIQTPNRAAQPFVSSSAAQIATEPAPATVLSLSPIQLKSGTAMLPPVVESPASNSPEGAGVHQAKSASAHSGKGSAASSGSAGAGDTGNGHGQLTATPVALPQSGQFSSVIVGDDLSDEFPELENAWGGRMAYTAYLHVGLAKSWILQYSLPKEALAAAGGSVSRLEAPWPYSIVRPNLPAGSVNADALMIHGFVNASGRFEDLRVVFPPPFATAQFVLAALRQWQFRPATQNGRPARVEVLLIVPEELE